MRLLNVNTLQFEVFHDKFIPPYGILSHTWGQARQKQHEVSYQEFRQYQRRGSIEWSNPLQDARVKEHHGLQKIIRCCEFVRRRSIFDFNEARAKRPTGFGRDDQDTTTSRLESLQWVWIDTVCVDQSSSSDVSEAINSMFWWYWYAEECFVYLSDVSSLAEFKRARWLRRGWTLQELLASKTRIFCSSEWQILGCIHTRKALPSYSQTYLQALAFAPDADLLRTVSKLTSIEEEYLDGSLKLKSASIAKRMSWAAQRETTRVEDRAYCLVGLFDVNLQPVYGEGRRAFVRLQEEIIRKSTDQSIFVWSYIGDENPDQVPEESREPVGLLATHPACFQSFNATDEIVKAVPYPLTITSLGLKWRCQSQIVKSIGVDSKCNLHLVELSYDVGCNDVANRERHEPVELVLLECNHEELPVFYRSRCNNRSTPQLLARLFPESEHDISRSLKFFARLTGTLEDQCKRCRTLDRMLIARRDEENNLTEIRE